MIERILRHRTPLAFAALLWLFYVAARSAYRGYFSADDLDNLAWTSGAGFFDFVSGYLNPFYYSSNFRPVGHLLYWLLGRTAGLSFGPYVAAVHLLHAANLALLWLILRRLRFAWRSAAAGVAFFTFHVAVFDAYWKPMYVFDVLCAFFSLLGIFAWIEKRHWLSLLCLWTAYKSKELAVATPFILAFYEYVLADGAIRNLLPQLGLSLWFGVQALLAQAGKPGDYGIRLTLATFVQTADYYASRILLLPRAGYALLALPWVVRDPRLWLGIAAALLWLAPMLLVPGRTSGAYLYLPIAGIAVAVAAMTERWSWRWTALPLLAWFALQYVQMRPLRGAELAEAADNRVYVAALREVLRDNPDSNTFLIDGAPPGMKRWGIEGATRYLLRKPGLEWIYVGDTPEINIKPEANLITLTWDSVQHQVFARRRTAEYGDESYLEITSLTPMWQMGSGWYQREGRYRWIMPKARARLRRPPDAKSFSVTVNVGPAQIEALRAVTLHVLLNDVEIGRHTFTAHGWSTAEFPLPKGDPGPVDVTFVIDPPFRPSGMDARALGIPIGAFGFR